jgi:putative ABC transport system permease protein
MSNRFDLDKSIAAWRRRYEHDPAFTPEDVRELERHVRDQVQTLVNKGLSEEEAFLRAMHDMGEHEEVRTAYRNVRWSKRRREESFFHHLLTEAAMLKNYLTIALRNLRRQKGYTFINVTGLAVGMACCLLIGLYIEDELSFDRFHEDVEQLMIMTYQSARGPEEFGNITPYPLASMMERELPEVEYAVRTMGGFEVPVSREETDLINDRLVLIADSTFFRAFTFPLIKGDPASALTAPDGAVISESMARAYFGREDPIGKTLKWDFFGSERTPTITGVAKDAPRNSTIRFDILVPLHAMPEMFRSENSWRALNFQTYVRLREPIPAEAFTEKASQSLSNHFAEDEEIPAVDALPLTSYYLSGLYETGNFKGQTRYVYIFGSIVVFVLLIAAINYVNLVTAQSTQRSREVGVRKTLGARRGELARQFLLESLLLSIAALLIALLLMAVALPSFNVLFEKELSLNLREHGAALAALSGIVLLVTVLASGYPAIVLSRFDPVQALRGAGSIVTSRGGSSVRKGLVIIQFTITVALITGTAIIYSQLRYVQNKDLGFDGEQVVYVTLPRTLTEQVRNAIKQDALNSPNTTFATLTNHSPGNGGVRVGIPPDGISSEAQTETETIWFQPGVVDYDFIHTLRIRIRAGRDFSQEMQSGEFQSVILNEAAAESMGWGPEEAVGKPFNFNGAGEVVGVIENYHNASLREEIGPIVLQVHADPRSTYVYQLAARLSPDDILGGVEHLRETLARYAPDHPFTYEFLDDRFDAMYRSEEQIGRIFTTFAVLAIIIACLGLFGLAAFTTERRSKEIGIRKVLGATVSNIVALLSKDFLKLVIAGFVIAVPVAYYFMSRWLEDFAYRIELGPGIFLLAGGLALFIALATVGYQAVRAALADPVKSLRYE